MTRKISEKSASTKARSPSTTESFVADVSAAWQNASMALVRAPKKHNLSFAEVLLELTTVMTVLNGDGNAALVFLKICYESLLEKKLPKDKRILEKPISRNPVEES